MLPKVGLGLLLVLALFPPTKGMWASHQNRKTLSIVILNTPTHAPFKMFKKEQVRDCSEELS